MVTTLDTTHIPKQVNLSCIMYNVRVVEEMVIFSIDCAAYARSQRFAFERKCNCWYLRPNGCEDIMMSHIEKAFKYVCEWFGDCFEGKRGEYHLWSLYQSACYSSLPCPLMPQTARAGAVAPGPGRMRLRQLSRCQRPRHRQ